MLERSFWNRVYWGCCSFSLTLFLHKFHILLKIHLPLSVSMGTKIPVFLSFSTFPPLHSDQNCLCASGIRMFSSGNGAIISPSMAIKSILTPILTLFRNIAFGNHQSSIKIIYHQLSFFFFFFPFFSHFPPLCDGQKTTHILN